MPALCGGSLSALCGGHCLCYVGGCYLHAVGGCYLHAVGGCYLHAVGGCYLHAVGDCCLRSVGGTACVVCRNPIHVSMLHCIMNLSLNFRGISTARDLHFLLNVDAQFVLCKKST